MRRDLLISLRNWGVLLALWEGVGRFRLVADGALPAPSAVIMRLIADWPDYPAHIWATVQGSFWGFVIGNSLAVVAALVLHFWPVMARLTRGLNVAIFALPAIALSPVLTLLTTGMTPRITLAALACYFITMMATLTGLTQADQRLGDLVRAYGGSRWTRLKTVEWRAALPQLLSGLRMSAPAAVLGSIMAEFGGGGRYGLGAYLIGSLGRAEPERLWGIGLVATLLSAAAYMVFAPLGARISGQNAAISVAISPPPAAVASNWRQGLVIGLASFALPISLWWGILALSGAPGMVAKTPGDIIEYLAFSPAALDNLGRLGAALAQTLPMTVLGMMAGLAFAFGLAILGVIRPEIVKALMPVALTTQTMPLVALTPLLVLIFGRGMSLILWVTISVTFFPAFVMIAQGLAQVPATALNVARAYGAGVGRQLRLVMIPHATPYLFSAMRMAVPRAFLGVMIAEWLATGTGLGNLLNQSRGYMDYSMIWTVAAVSVLVSVLFYQLVVVVERRVLRALGMRSGE